MNQAVPDLAGQLTARRRAFSAPRWLVDQGDRRDAPIERPRDMSRVSGEAESTSASKNKEGSKTKAELVERTPGSLQPSSTAPLACSVVVHAPLVERLLHRSADRSH